MIERETSVFESSLSAEAKLERARTELLDLSARNRLLNVPRFSKTAKTIEIVDEKTAEIYRLLVREGKALTFAPGRPDRVKKASSEVGIEELASDDDDEDNTPVSILLPEDDASDERGFARRHSDTRLQTRMTPSGLQKRLLDLFHDARTLEEEQGVNVLFLALGTLKWIDPNNKENIRHAPLVLIPVKLERGTAGERFRLTLRPEDLTANLSLEAYLDRVHTLSLPAPAFGDDFDPSAYFDDVAASVSTKEAWTVQQDDVILGFFSFAKFLMYRDLDPENWPKDAGLCDHEIVAGLLADGFRIGEPLLPEDARVDDHLQPLDMLHIVDSDSSQTLAVHEVRKGRNLIIQGPPGTGKSQTIANVIGSAVADGKTVLFVAEKMAALEVVKRRLDQAGVGDVCLELHSNKSNKRALLEELRRTWELGSPRGDYPNSIADKLLYARNELNDHVQRLHAPHEVSSLSPYQVIGHLVRLRQNGQGPVDLDFEGSTGWTPDDFARRHQLVHELTQRIDEIGLPVHHPWHGIGLNVVLPTTVERLSIRISALADEVETLIADTREMSDALDLSETPSSLGDIAGMAQRAEWLATAPVLTAASLAAPIWDADRAGVRALVKMGSAYGQMKQALGSVITAEAANTTMEGVEAQLAWLPESFTSEDFVCARELAKLLPQLVAQASRLRAELGGGEIDTIAAIARLAATAERVAAAPDASPEAFAATVWDHGLDRADDVAQAVATLEMVRAKIGDRVVEVAWRTDVAAARQALATNTGMLKALNGDWRRAKALARSLLRDQSTVPEQIVVIFDDLMEGQRAGISIRENDAFGQSAFGANWRGEKSQSAPLLALVAWMRTLRGLGSEPRLIAGRLAERGPIGEAAQRTQQMLDHMRPLALRLWSALGTQASAALAGAPTMDRAPLQLLEERLAALRWVDGECFRLLDPIPDTVAERLKRLRYLDKLQRAGRAVDAGEERGRAAFDEAWAGRDGDWVRLDVATGWIEAHGDLRHLAAQRPERRDYPSRVAALVKRGEKVRDEFTGVLDALKADPAIVLGAVEAAAAPLASMAGRLRGWLGNMEQLSKWVAWRERADTAQALGLTALVDRLSDGRLITEAALPTFEMAYYDALLVAMTHAAPELGRFDGELHGHRVLSFANLDRERIKAASLEVVRAHHKRIPPRDGAVGPLGILRGEMARKRSHMPIRQLMQRAGSAVQALKPVMMMSPLSVAQFLTPGHVSFDLLVMDEASQIQPVDALGAIARARQVVVVGDERQLPPTSFFAKLTGAQEEDDGEGAQVADIESILGLFSARGLPQRMLRWHYRSRHQSLIAVSNNQFYENKLFIVPSPYTQEAGMGLAFHHVPNGVFEENVNRAEARTIAEAAIRHARSHPELSLGVCAFSVTQRRAIQDELEALRRANPDTEAYFQAHHAEPFFVKNLENVQGDERDVIMISVGYARNAQGYMAMRFGPLGAEGGERRLNVLISRAKRRCEVFASITDDDIDTERGRGKGVFAFKLFLRYARTGKLDIPRVGVREMDSLFEEQVARVLKARGYQVSTQVGLAGFFIDLAVGDAERPGRYLLGIECDGAAYHSSRSARDRDRLRQAVLEDHGWIIHRIWSYDWFQRPHEQTERLLAAIEAARAELDARMELSLQRHRAVPVQIVTVDRGDVVEIGLMDTDRPDTSGEVYIEATIDRAGPYELHETPIGLLANLVEQVVKVESPVHIDEVTLRLRDAWDLGRAGSRVQAAVEEAARIAVAQDLIKRDGDFLLDPAALPRLRNRQSVLSTSLRKPEMLPPSEVAVGIIEIVESNMGATEDELVGTLARRLGFKATSSQLRELLLNMVRTLVAEGRLIRRNELVVLSDESFNLSKLESELA